MFGSLLLVLSALGAEPLESLSLATCARPLAKLIEPKIEHAAGATRSSDCHLILSWLRRWESAAHHDPALSTARRDVLRYRIETHTNAHAATALELMIGPIDVLRLRESFVWTILDREAGRVHLEASPRDETEQLFYASIRIDLNEADGSLNQLQIVSRSGETCFAWKNDIAHETPLIQLVSVTDNALPAITPDELPSPSAVEVQRRFLVREIDCESLPTIR